MPLKFIPHRPGPEDCWRGIILFGQNVASYKFALSLSLLELRPTEGQLVRLEELAIPYSRYLCDHTRQSDRQITSSQSRIFDGCRRANAGELSQEKLAELVTRHGFDHVLDAFHIVGRDAVPQQFFIDERDSHSGIRITEAFAILAAGEQALNLRVEAEARWRLVETAWSLGVSRALLTVQRDADGETLFVVDPARRRKNVTGVRDALSGYQRGRCFYCFDKFSLSGSATPDVDHFFPYTLQAAQWKDVDEIWNFVLSCRRCNRGVDGKSDRLPHTTLLERLYRRNEFLIESRHPLRETLLRQTGADEAKRRAFLSDHYRWAGTFLHHEWVPLDHCEPLF
jgi:5-methylcytosine-specific restriction endonuclease McrA